MLGGQRRSSTRYSLSIQGRLRRRILVWPARTSSMTAFGIRILGARRSIKSSRAIRENKMTGEALTTHASLTMDLVLQLLWGHLHDWDAPMCELVDEFRATRAGDLGSLRLRELSCEYQSRAAATRISFTNSVGDKRRAESAPSGRSKVIVGIVRGSQTSE